MRLSISRRLQAPFAPLLKVNFLAACHVAFVAIPIGIIVGMAVAAYDYVVNTVVWDNFSRQFDAPILYFLPMLGMILTGMILRSFKISSSAMADEIVKIYHEKTPVPGYRMLIPKLFASVATMGFGCSAGMEGASKWLGGMIGASAQSTLNHFPRLKWSHAQVEQTMLAGAAAGIGAIFRAPLTGAIMGIESPYRKDLAHDALTHGLVASAVSYATFSFLRDGNPYFPIRFHYVLNVRDLFLCVFVGIGAGLVSRVFLKTLVHCRSFGARLETSRIPLLKFIAGGALLSIVAYASFKLIGEAATLQAGLPVANRLIAGNYALTACLFILVTKLIATSLTFGLGGVGGLFLPSATIGAAYGAVCDLLLMPTQPGLFTLVGIAAFTGASYNSLLFSAVFIAEASGSPALIVPGLIASVFAYLVSVGVSNSPSQRLKR